MTTMTLKSRECLIEDIKCLEFKLSNLQERFDVIVTWIRSQYCEVTDLPDYVLMAVRGDQSLSDEKNELRKIEHIKVKYNHFDDSTEDSSHLNGMNDTLADGQCKNVVAVKVAEEILKSIKSGPVSRMRAQLQQRKLACRDISTTVHEKSSSSFPLLTEGDFNLKWENDQLIGDNSSDCNITEDANESNLHHTIRDFDAPSTGFKNKRVIKTAKHVEANKAKGLVLDAVEYKKRVASLPKDRLTCLVCSKGFPTPTKLRRHEFEVHLTKEEQNKLRNRSSAPVNVMEKPTNVEPTICDICNLPFRNIESHKMNHLPLEVMTTVEGSWRPHYRCLKCDLLFSEKKKYLDHVMRDCKAEEILENSNYAQYTQKLRTEKNFLCNQCGQAFNRKHTLKIHVVAVHAKRKDFKCKFCEKAFAIEFVKNNHEKKHLGISSVKCDLCGFTFTCKKGLKKHIEGVHENRRPYQCTVPLCGKSFKTVNARKYHINTHGNPNGRKRGLNRDVDPIHAAAKRRNCITWKNNRVQPIENLETADNAKTTEETEEK